MFSKLCSSFSYSEFKCFQNCVHILVIQSSNVFKMVFTFWLFRVQMFSKLCSSFSYSELKCFQNCVHLLVIQSSNVFKIVFIF